MNLCEHVSGCDRHATAWIEVDTDDQGGTRMAGLCEEHNEQRGRTKQELQWTLSTLEIRCSDCGNLAPEGLLWHSCDNPSPQPPDAEQ